MRIIFFAVTLMCANFSFAVPMSIEQGNRLWLPCQVGKCMIDSAGSGSLLTVDPSTQNLPVLKKTEITSVQGKISCDLLVPMNFKLADKIFANQQFTRCAEFPSKYSPMLGLPFLNSQAFEMLFSTKSFNWIDRIKSPKFMNLTNLQGWITFNAELRGIPITVVFDTGAPTALIDIEFANGHPEIFRPNAQASDFFFSIDPIVVNTQAIPLKNIKAANLKFLGIDQKNPILFLGMDSIQENDWEFDVAKGIFAFKRIR